MHFIVNFGIWKKYTKWYGLRNPACFSNTENQQRWKIEYAWVPSDFTRFWIVLIIFLYIFSGSYGWLYICIYNFFVCRISMEFSTKYQMDLILLKHLRGNKQRIIRIAKSSAMHWSVISWRTTAQSMHPWNSVNLIRSQVNWTLVFVQRGWFCYFDSSRLSV